LVPGNHDDQLDTQEFSERAASFELGFCEVVEYDEAQEGNRYRHKIHSFDVNGGIIHRCVALTKNTIVLGDDPCNRASCRKLESVR
jgi:hypothetical protein